MWRTTRAGLAVYSFTTAGGCPGRGGGTPHADAADGILSGLKVGAERREIIEPAVWAEATGSVNVTCPSG